MADDHGAQAQLSEGPVPSPAQYESTFLGSPAATTSGRKAGVDSLCGLLDALPAS
ncbi:MAG: hypothetical protein M3Y89_18255 [Actinomycetota bacterium]|nr:hypothetical protein [Actinomycetota bacterium]